MNPFWSAVVAMVTAISVLAAVALTSYNDGKRAAEAAERDERRRRLARAEDAAHEMLRLAGRAVDVYLPEDGRDRHEVRVEGNAIARDVRRLAIDIRDKPTRDAIHKIASGIEDAQFIHRVYPMAAWTAVYLANEAARDVLGAFVGGDPTPASKALASLSMALDAVEENRQLQRDTEEQHTREQRTATPSDPADTTAL